MSWSWADEATRQAASLLPHLTCCICLLARLQCYVILICQRDMEGAALGEHGRLGLGK